MTIEKAMYESNLNTELPMTTQTQDKATPRPWSFAPAGSNMRDNYNQSFAIAQWPVRNLIAGLFDDVQGGTETAKANAALIVRAVNEYDALCSVAEAAKASFPSPSGGRHYSDCGYITGDDDGQCSCGWNDFCTDVMEYRKTINEALAALEAVRKGAQ